MSGRLSHVRPLRVLATVTSCLVGLAASNPSEASVYVGNPKIAVRLADASGLGFSAATTTNPALELEPCGTTAVGTGSTNVHGSQTVVEPEFCGVRLDTDGLLTITGTGPSSSSFTLELALDAVTVTLSAAEGMGPLDDGAAYYLELGSTGWTTATALGLSPSTHTTIDSGDAVHDDLVDALLLDSSVFIDTDGNGLLSSAERSAGSL